MSAATSVPADSTAPSPVPGPALRDLALARAEVDRSSHLRADADWLDAAWADPQTRVLAVERGRSLVKFDEHSAQLQFLSPSQAPSGVRFLLGVDDDGIAYFGVAGPVSEQAIGGMRPVSLREAGPLLSDRDAGLMTHAVALANWHETFTHCPRCGTPTEPFASGHARRCPVDASEHFPRVDPAMIVLVFDEADRCLLARNAMWPERRVSILAGFVEAGESVEQAVAREVREETSIVVGAVQYLGSQPWPMPQSLMLGFRAAATGSTDIKVDADEIAEANWYSRDDLTAAIENGDLLLPPPVSIAHRIIESWYGRELPGSW
ncbi:MAG TPA: NAD(+) diphosphatase [Streptosporangiaceae bacterium]|nr:NAD(+) diphosphatase [Streptosporangiaceae bacterium]